MKKKNLSNLSLSKNTISNLDVVRGGIAKTAAGGHGTCCMSCVNWTKGDDCKVEERPADPSPADH
ncbi:class I lanthipeptide [Kordia algicida OT-1]|uniref:Uncharacterized protein n=1 Tax=Kordia algicida OT-1 TaxID=391587 RepID=A9DT31_9FLAO|nr:class I lanthipeptide [Kordia algicida]EDP97017.1 hypothetical protein KAOT1_17678 [Kordia algicida OT-1]